MIDKFEGKFPRLSKVNSFTLGTNIFYIKKIKSVYVCWDYESKYKVMSTDSRDRLVDWIEKNIKEIKRRIDERSKN